jgi:hypothetical protein
MLLFVHKVLDSVLMCPWYQDEGTVDVANEIVGPPSMPAFILCGGTMHEGARVKHIDQTGKTQGPTNHLCEVFATYRKTNSSRTREHIESSDIQKHA